MSRRRRSCLVVLALAGLAALPGAAGARAPAADQIANAVAKQNRTSGRAVALAIEVELRMGAGPAVLARGSLVADPGGASRLELLSPRGTWERHLRSGGRLRAVRDGRDLANPRAFLPPFHLLLAGDPETLVAGFAALGGRPAEVGLGYEGGFNCWVLGGRAAGPGPPARTALWVDRESLRVVRIDLAGGPVFRLGPPQRFGRIEVPEWIEAGQADAPRVRLGLRGARRLGPAKGRFDPAWLRAAPPAAAPAPPAD